MGDFLFEGRRCKEKCLGGSFTGDIPGGDKRYFFFFFLGENREELEKKITEEEIELQA